MHIKKVIITNFKSYRNPFHLDLDEGLNIIVGNNETGKSTILEAIHLALTGLNNGRYFINDLSEYYFNYQSVQEYLNSVKEGNPIPPPEFSIEIFIAGDNLPFFEGDGNSTKKNECGICFKVSLAEKYRSEYELYISEGTISALPIEFYEVNWTTCARDSITPRKIPIKSALIDSSSSRFKSGSDVYISHILKNHLEDKDKNDLTHAHRRLQANFVNDNSVQRINSLIKNIAIEGSLGKTLSLTIDLSSRDAWESSFLTSVEDIPFHHIGKGEQAIIKTKLALEHKKVKEANIILIEEPENHLSHSKLNQLIKDIHDKCLQKQILISTHNSFVANKLGLEKLIILDNKRPIRLKNLNDDTQLFFEKLPGYDTLRLILCKKAILVEGDCDELLVQRAYMDLNNGRLPIEDQIDVISVGTTFLRFLEIAEKVGKKVSVVTDNDGSVEAINKKYKEYLRDNSKSDIKICFDEDVDLGNLVVGKEGKAFNYNTLEPKFMKENGIKKMNKIFGKDLSENEMHLFMREHKTTCALQIFKTKEVLKFPQYILDAITY